MHTVSNALHIAWAAIDHRKVAYANLAIRASRWPSYRIVWRWVKWRTRETQTNWHVHASNCQCHRRAPENGGTRLRRNP